MKKIILPIAILSITIGAFVTSCNTPAEKVADAQDNVLDANKELAIANDEYLKDIEQYRKETAEKIEANNKSIAEFKARKESDKKEIREEYRTQINTLEQKNSDMKKKMDEYQASSKEQWESFKTEFGRDMDELGKSFKDLTVKNVK